MVDVGILKLIQFIVATAVRKRFRSLTTIHIVKYLYLADYFNAKTEGRTITGLEWKFHTYGPWSLNSYRGIEAAVNEKYIQTKVMKNTKKSNKLDESNEYTTFYVDPEKVTDAKYERLGKEVLPKIRTRIALEHIIEKYGLKTNPLLNYVYNRTEPMQDAVKGDGLCFKNLSWPTRQIENIPLEKRKIKKAKEILKKIKNSETPVYYPPKGEYDDLYFRCVDILNEQDKLEIDEGVEVIASIKDIAI